VSEAAQGVAEATPARRSLSRSVVIGSAALCGLLLTGALIMQRTQAAFTGTTSNSANSWQAGTITLGDDDTGAALFSASDLLPGATGSRCISVTYTADVASTVKLYVASSSGSLAPYVDLVVEEGSGAGNTGGFGAGCAGFSGASIYTGTLSAFASASTSHATGVGTFAPAASTDVRVYRFTYTLSAATPSAQQGQSASAVFQWESRTS
jgi:hypothetical protein